MKKISKQLVALLLAVVMVLPMGVLSANPFVTQAEAATTNKTKADAIEWLKSKEGKKLDYDNAYGGQCVDLIYYYYGYLGAAVVGGNASDYTSNKLPSGWTRVKGGTPQKGDILVYAGAGGYGHVAVYENDTTTWHQNWNEHQYVEKVSNVNYKVIRASDGSGYWGYIRPDFKDGGVTDSPKVTVDTSSDKYSITNTNAVLCGNIYNPFGAKVSKCGIKLYDENGTLIKDFSNSISYTVTNVEIWFNINSEIGYTLTRGTKYKYILYGVVDGKTYSTSTQTFTTKGGYTLIYNANGGTEAPSSQSGLIKYTVSSNVPTRSGYTFLGWSTNSSATSAAYVGGNTISLSSNTTLYAVWKKNESVSYTVTFYGNGGTNVPEAETFSAGEWITIPEDMPSFLGYTFSGWSETADFSSAVYYPGDEVSFGGNVNLFAIWREYHASEGYTGLDISYEQPYYCMKFVPEETGEYVIKTTTVEEPVDTIGYLVNGNGETIVDDDDSGEDFNFKISYTFTKGRTYYIYITTYGDNYGNVGLTVMPTAEITYDANGGYDAPDKSSHDIDYLIPDDEPYRDDYEFIGWSERSDAESASYYPGDDITVTEDLTLYAVWYSLSSEFYVYYDANGGYNAPQTQFIESNAIGYIPDEEPVRDGYIFEGWCDNANGNGSWYYPGDMIRDSVDQEDITLYAIWEEEEIDDPVDPDDPLLPGCLTIRTPSITTIKYGDTIKLHADMGNAPVAGLKVEWEFNNDNFEIVSISEDGRTCTITPSKSGQTTFTAKVKLGSRLLSSDTQVMTSKAGFFDKLIAFFREIFGLLKDYEQAIGVMFY